MRDAAAFLYVATPVLSLSIDIFVQVLSFRLFPGIGLLKSVYAGFFAGFCGLVITNMAYSCLYRGVVYSSIANMVIYAASGYCYFHFVGLGETARRVRILAEIYDSKSGLSQEDILDRYNAKEIIEKRMKRLLGNRQLICRDGRYFIGRPAVLLISHCVTLLKFVFLGRGSEFDRKAA